MKNALLALLNDLDKIAVKHGEIHDTAVREELHEVIFAAFVKPEADYELPTYYAMFSDEADAQIRAVLVTFLNHPEVAAAAQLQTAKERLAVFQDDDLQSNEGSYAGDFFGWASIP